MQVRLSTEERQSEIVAAAVRLARDSSPALITTGDIAASIGVTQGTVFKHFPTKDAIWLAAMRWVHEALLHKLRARADQAATPRDALSAVFRAHVEFIIEHPGVPRLIFHELQQPALSAAKLEVRAVLQDYHKLLLGLLAQAVAQRQLSKELDLEAAATGFIGLLQGLVMQSMMSGRPGAMRQRADRVYAFFQRGLGGAP